MNTYWQVEQITEKPGIVLAELRPVIGFKMNPARAAADAEYAAFADDHGDEAASEKFRDVDYPDEFIDAVPGDPNAEITDGEGPHITIDITDGPELHPLDCVALALTVLATVDA